MGWDRAQPPLTPGPAAASPPPPGSAAPSSTGLGRLGWLPRRASRWVGTGVRYGCRAALPSGWKGRARAAEPRLSRATFFLGAVSQPGSGVMLLRQRDAAFLWVLCVLGASGFPATEAERHTILLTVTPLLGACRKSLKHPRRKDALSLLLM